MINCSALVGSHPWSLSVILKYIYWKITIILNDLQAKNKLDVCKEKKTKSKKIEKHVVWSFQILIYAV